MATIGKQEGNRKQHSPAKNTKGAGVGTKGAHVTTVGAPSFHGAPVAPTPVGHSTGHSGAPSRQDGAGVGGAKFPSGGNAHHGDGVKKEHSVWFPMPKTQSPSTKGKMNPVPAPRRNVKQGVGAGMPKHTAQVGAPLTTGTARKQTGGQRGR